MKLKRLLLIFSIVFLLSSCTTFKPVPKRAYVIDGVFKANVRGRYINGFFSLNGRSLRLSILNSLGFGVADVYLSRDRVEIRDFQSGKIYHSLRIDGLDLKRYKSVFVYFAENFIDLCNKKAKDIVVLRCKHVNNFYIPTDFIFVGPTGRIKMELEKIKIAGG